MQRRLTSEGAPALGPAGDAFAELAQACRTQARASSTPGAADALREMADRYEPRAADLVRPHRSIDHFPGGGRG